MKKKSAVRSFCSILLLAAALGGCATIDSHVRVDGWPELKIVEHEVGYREMRKHCLPYTGPLESPIACTVFYFDAGEAHIYVARQLKFKAVLEHERLHAMGYDHHGSNSMKQILERWQAAKKAELARAQAEALEETELAALAP